MRYLITILALSLVGCATGYKKAVSATYMGNNTYTITGGANYHTHRATLVQYTARKAFEVCSQKHQSGFVILRDEKRGTNGVDPYGNVVHSPSSDTTIECKGPIDPQMQQLYGSLED